MRPFTYERAANAGDALRAIANASPAPSASSAVAAAQFLAGGTTLVDLMKLDVMRPPVLIDINELERSEAGEIAVESNAIRLGALVRMAEAAEHAEVKRRVPMIAQSLQLAASQQLRIMASLGGNVLQRTRCPYFRDVSYPNCNKRLPGSGCAALDGFNRSHAVLGVSDRCIASYPGDFAQALIALDAEIEIAGPRRKRRLAFADLHRLPADTPQVETALQPGELITAFVVPTPSWARRSLYLKVRDRESYEFALASAAVALDMEAGVVREARIALGGVASVPWRSRGAEAALKGKPVDRAAADAADTAFADAVAHEHNAFKLDLGRRTLTRALHQAAAMEV